MRHTRTAFIKRSFLIIFCFVFIGLPFDSCLAETAAEPRNERTNSLQQLIDESHPHDTLTIPNGTYDGPLTIDKPLKLTATGRVVIRATSELPAVTIRGRDVTLEHVQLTNRGKTAPAALKVSGTGHAVQHVVIDTESIGIQLADAKLVTVKDVTVNGLTPANQLHKGNGIDLDNAHNNTITDSQIARVQDGVYVEHSNDNIIMGNTITHSRYGVHLMFTSGTKLVQNDASENITGFMIMETEQATVGKNRAYNNKRHVHAQGMLLFETYDSNIANNDLVDNSVGLYFESGTDNRVAYNDIRQNFIALRVKDAKKNEIVANDFVANVVQGQGIGAADNAMRANYWDDAAVLDVTGDGKSAWKHAMDPYFLTVVQKHPAYQLLFQAPGMFFIQKLLRSPEERIFYDDAPRVKPNRGQVAEPSDSERSVILSLSTLLLGCATLFYLFGRK